MTVTSLSGSDHVALGDRLRYLLALRVAIAVTTVAFAAATTASLGVPLETLAGLAVCYLAVALVFEWIGQQVPGASFASLTVMLLVDGVFLAAAVYATGGTESPLRFLVYIHLVAVSLLASYRTGLKIALWHSLLVLVVLYAQAAAILPPVDVQPGAPTIGSLPVISVTAFWLFALATSLFSALNERELRQRREDLESLVAMGTRLDDEGDPFQQASFVLEGLADRYAFPAGPCPGRRRRRDGHPGQPGVAGRSRASRGCGGSGPGAGMADQVADRAAPAGRHDQPGARRAAAARPADHRLPDGGRRPTRGGPRARASGEGSRRGAARHGRRGTGRRHGRAEPPQLRAAASRAGSRRAGCAHRRRQSSLVPGEPGARRRRLGRPP